MSVPVSEVAHRVRVGRVVVDGPDVLVEPDPHRGVDDARSEGVHGDSVLDQAAGGCLSDGQRAELRDAVRDEVPVSLPAGDRPGVDDLSA